MANRNINRAIAIRQHQRKRAIEIRHARQEREAREKAEAEERAQAAERVQREMRNAVRDYHENVEHVFRYGKMIACGFAMMCVTAFAYSFM